MPRKMETGLLPPPSRTAANRSCGADHIARLSFIHRARNLGFSLETVRELVTLSDDKAQSCEAADVIYSRTSPKSSARSPTFKRSVPH